MILNKGFSKFSFNYYNIIKKVKEGLKIKRKSVLLLVFVVAVSLTLTGCFGPFGDDEDPTWEIIYGSGFILSYPEDWFRLDGDAYRAKIGNEETEDESTQIISFFYEMSNLTEDEETWEEYKDDLDGDYEGEKEEITVDGYPAYKIHKTGEVPLFIMDMENATFDLVYINKNDKISLLTYAGKEDYYSSDMSEEIIDLFEFE